MFAVHDTFNFFLYLRLGEQCFEVYTYEKYKTIIFFYAKYSYFNFDKTKHL